VNVSEIWQLLTLFSPKTLATVAHFFQKSLYTHRTRFFLIKIIFYLSLWCKTLSKEKHCSQYWCELTPFIHMACNFLFLFFLGRGGAKIGQKKNIVTNIGEN
jgi:hypothetical protein